MDENLFWPKGGIVFRCLTRHLFNSFVFLCCLIQPLAADSQEIKTLTFATPQYHPLTLLGYEIISEAYQNIGYQVAIDYYPHERALYMSNSGQVDGELGRVGSIDPNYENLLRVPVSFLSLKMNSVSMKNASRRETQLPELKQFRVGLIRGSKFLEYLFTDSDTILTQNTGQLLRLLKKGRVDYAIADTILVEVELAKGKLDKKLFDSYTLPDLTSPIFHFLHKRHQSLVPLIHAELLKMKQNGRIAALEQNFMACVRKGRLQFPDREHPGYSCPPMITANLSH